MAKLAAATPWDSTYGHSLGWFFHHDGMYAWKCPLPICVLCGLSCPAPSFPVPVLHTLVSQHTGSFIPQYIVLAYRMGKNPWNIIFKLLGQQVWSASPISAWGISAPILYIGAEVTIFNFTLYIALSLFSLSSFSYLRLPLSPYTFFPHHPRLLYYLYLLSVSISIPSLILKGESCSNTSRGSEWQLITPSNGSLHRVFACSAGGPGFDSRPKTPLPPTLYAEDVGGPGQAPTVAQNCSVHIAYWYMTKKRWQQVNKPWSPQYETII